MNLPGLQTHLIPSLPPSCYYIPNFITVSEETSLLSVIKSHPSQKWTHLSHRRLLSLPSPLTGSSRDTLLESSLPSFLHDPIVPRFHQLEIFKNSPHKAPNHVLINEYHPNQGIMPHEDGPIYHHVTATVSLGSHTVLNIYEKDVNGNRETSPTWRILQEPRSLLVTTESMYENTLHGIEEREIDEDLGRNEIVNWDLLGDPDGFLVDASSITDEPNGYCDVENDHEDRQISIPSLLHDRNGKIMGRKRRGLRVSLTYRDVLKVAKIGGALKFMNRGSKR